MGGIEPTIKNTLSNFRDASDIGIEDLQAPEKIIPGTNIPDRSLPESWEPGMFKKKSPFDLNENMDPNSFIVPTDHWDNKIQN